MMAGCSKEQSARSARENRPAVAVQVTEALASSQAVIEPAVGTIRPKLRAVIEAKTSGRIESVPARLGDAVKKGDLLARIDAQELAARRDQARATRDQAETELKRFAELLAGQALPQSEFDAAQMRFRVADGALREAETLMSYTAVAAPFDGVVVRRLADVGDLALPGKPLLELEDPRQMRLIADVPEGLVGKLKAGDTARVQVPAAQQELSGQVVEMAPAGDSASRTFRVEVDLPPSALRSGMFGRLLIPTDERPVILLPTASIVRRGQLEIVFVESKGTVALRLVRTGKALADQTEILAGIEPGDRVVVNPPAALQDGDPIQVQ